MKNANRDDGAIAILVALLSVALFGFGAIVVDLGMARDLKGQAASSADAAALAGIGEFVDCQNSVWRCRRDAKDAVRDSVDENYQVTTWAGCQGTPPGVGQPVTWIWRTIWNTGSCIQFGTAAGDPRPTLVFVSLPPRTSSSAFGGIFDFQGVSISSSAVAGQFDTQIPGCALCVLDALEPDGGIITVSGAGTLYAERLDASAASHGMVNSAAGTYLTEAPPSDSAAVFNPPPVVTGVSVTDPLSSNQTGLTGPLGDADCVSGTLPPGKYRGLDVDTICELSGVYEFNDDVTVSGILNGSGTGTTILLRDDASLTVTGGSVTIPGPDPSSRFAIHSDAGSVQVAGSLTVTGDVSVLDGDIRSVSGITRVTGSVHVPQDDLDVVSGVVQILGTTSVRDLNVTSGSVSVQSDGAGVPQQGRPGVALVR